MKLKIILFLRLIVYLILFHGVLSEAGLWTAIAISLPLTISELHIVRIRLILEQMIQDDPINHIGE